jgi:pimeloyl-ACP methyl ester carboxylesterase
MKPGIGGLAMKKPVLMLMAAVVAGTVSGCSWFSEKGALPEEFHPSMFGTHRVLVVFLPGIGGKGSDYETQGFLKALQHRGFEASMKVLDVKPSLYLGSKIVELLKTKVLTHDKAKGYEKIYLVGISLGGHAVLRYLTEYPDDVEGAVVLAPFISGPVAADAVRRAGGLARWEDCPFAAWEYACEMWYSLKTFVSNPDHGAKIVLGYGTEDRFARQCGILAEVLRSEQVFTVAGGHDWATWKKLWIEVLDYFRLVRPYRE